MVVATVVYLRRRIHKDGRGRRSGVLFAIGALATAIAIGYVAFLWLPWPLCEAFAQELGGAWCGLTAYVAAPIGFIVGMMIFSAIWSMKGVRPNSAMDSDTYSAPLRAPVSARHCGR